MRLKLASSLVFAVAMLFIACDDETGTVGSMLTDDVDQLEVTSSSFKISSRSVSADAVIARSSTGYLGRIKDPETGAYVTNDFMTQFNCMQEYRLTPRDSVASLGDDGDVVADSCELRLYYEQFYGDSLSLMSATAYEMGIPMSEAVHYYTDFDPIAAGLIREDGIQKETVYTLVNSAEKETEKSTDYMNNICLRLNDPYTDKNGVTYNNFGTYILRSYYNHPEYFKNGITFTKNVLPGMYIKMTGGMGGVAYITAPQLNIYYRIKVNADSIANRITFFSGTEEVLQTTRITNDTEKLSQLVADESCTYVKGPAGIYTEITLPVEEILQGHENDTINTAYLKIPRYNNTAQSIYNLSTPSQLMMIEKDSLSAFFEQGKLANYKETFLCSYSSSTNSYIFNNISNLISQLNAKMKAGMAADATWKTQHPNWNKVLLVPVSTTSYSDSYGMTHITSVKNDITLSSCRLVGGKDALTMNVIYSKFR